MNQSVTTTQTENSLSFMLPRNMAEAIQFAEMLANSDLVPKDYQRKAGNILVAMQWGAEIGMQPLQSLQNISCINGRPAIWGDAMLALVRQSGLLEYIKEWDENDTAHCEVKRKGAEARLVTFSAEDSKRAGLMGKTGPWSQYPKRMRQMRARGYALRDEFTDVLKGMRMAEEIQDEPVERDINPDQSKPEPKPHSGSAALKGRLSGRGKKADSIEGQAIVFDVDAVVDRINAATTLADLKAIAKEVPSDLGEPAKTTVKSVYQARLELLKQQDAEQQAQAKPEPEPEPQADPEPARDYMPRKSVEAIIAEFKKTTDSDVLSDLWRTRVSDHLENISEADQAQLDMEYSAQLDALNA